MLYAAAAAAGEIAAICGGSILADPYQCRREMSRRWQLAFLLAVTDRAISLRWARDIPPAQHHQRIPYPGEIESMLLL